MGCTTMDNKITTNVVVNLLVNYNRNREKGDNRCKK